MTFTEFKAMVIRLHANELLILPKLFKSMNLDLNMLGACAKLYLDDVSFKPEDKTPKELRIKQENALEARFCLLLIYTLLEEERYDLEVILPDIQKKIREAGENEEVKFR